MPATTSVETQCGELSKFWCYFVTPDIRGHFLNRHQCGQSSVHIPHKVLTSTLPHSITWMFEGLVTTYKSFMRIPFYRVLRLL